MKYKVMKYKVMNINKLPITDNPQEQISYGKEKSRKGNKRKR